LVAGTQEVTVADDGTLLRAVPTSGLPVIPVKAPPGGSRVADRPTQAKVAVLAAAPASLRSRVTKVVLGPHGLTVDLGSGPQLRFGDGRRLHAKWLAAARVMSDPGAADATYIDVRVPERPAAGGLSLAQGGAPEAQPQASSDPAAAAGTAATGAPGAGVGASGALGTATTTASAPSAGQGTVTTAPAAGAPGAVTTTPAAVSGGATAPAASAP
ncbi:MAG TPA: cell division protein FtsQ/DivIB, partial [Solirubrobacteraceae bacterium]|nr:cell division protein FtsQ/DivIB [Solirubrobacteraceae bacterium]